MYGNSMGNIVYVFIFIGALTGFAIAGIIWLIVWLWPAIKAWLHAVTA